MTRTAVSKPIVRQYERHSILPLKDTFDKMIEISQNAGPRGFDKERFDFNGVPIKVGTTRVQTFLRHGLVCSCCGMKATHWAIERNVVEAKRNPASPYHVNLWGVGNDGDEVLFTHDHAQSLADAGADSTRNTQTMCIECNKEKAANSLSYLPR